MNEAVFFNGFLIGWTILAIVVFISLLFINAPYGRHERKGWGRGIEARQGWLIMEFPALAAPFLFFFLSGRSQNTVSVCFLALWELHYIQRALIYPLVKKKSSHKMPFLILFFGLVFNLCNGYLNGRFLFALSPLYPVSWMKSARFITGVVLFIGGYFINIRSDSILRRLRSEGDTGYGIPKEGFFKYISSPNYFGEILEWTGWALATWCLPGAAFALWSIANLAPRALANHRWYLKTFPDYPRRRKALIPFIL